MDIQSALKKGQSILIDNNIISAKLDSEILMSQAIRKNKIGRASCRERV